MIFDGMAGTRYENISLTYDFPFTRITISLGQVILEMCTSKKATEQELG